MAATPGVTGLAGALGSLAAVPDAILSQQEADRQKRIQEEEIARRRAAEDKQTSRQDLLWQDQMTSRAAEAAKDETEFQQTINPAWSPVEEAYKHVQGLAPQPVPAAPAEAPQGAPAPGGIPSPNPAGGPVGLVNPDLFGGMMTPAPGQGPAPAAPAPAMGGGAPGPAPAPAAAPQPKTPLQGVWGDLQDEYVRKVQTPMQNAWERLKAQGMDTPEAKAALMRTFRDRTKDLQAKLDSTLKSEQQKAVRDRAIAGVDAMLRHDNASIQAVFGPGTHWDRDKKTGWEGVRMPDGVVQTDGSKGTIVGQDQIMAYSFFKNGLLDEKDFTKMWNEGAQSYIKFLDEYRKDRIASARVGAETKNKDIEKANYAGQVAYDQAIKAGRSKEDAEQARLDAKDRSINVGVERADAYRDRARNDMLSKLSESGRKSVNDAVNASVSKDLSGNPVRKVGPIEALKKFKALRDDQKFSKEDRARNAIVYASSLIRDSDPEKDQMAEIDKELAKMQSEEEKASVRESMGVGASEPKDSSYAAPKKEQAKPAGKLKPVPADTLKSAKAAIARGAKVEDVKKRLRDSGFDDSGL